MRVLLVIALAGCPYTTPTATPGDGPAGDDDAPGDGDGDTPPPVDCTQKWIDGMVTFPTADRIANFQTSNDERNAWLNRAETEIFFSRIGNNDTDVFFSRRSSVAIPFNSAALASNASDNNSDDGKLSLTADGTVGVLTTRRLGDSDLFEVTRATPGTQDFDSVVFTPYAAIDTPGEEVDPHLSDDGLRVYFAQGSPRQIQVAERTALGLAFAINAPVPGVNDSNDNEDPSLNSDERVIVFTSTRLGTRGLFYATRPDRAQPFGTPIEVPNVNEGVADERDPHLSPDGCHLYYSSNRTGNFDIFLSTVQ